MPLPLLPLLGMATSLIPGIGDAISARRNTNKTIQANKQMAEYAYQKDLEMWNRQNAYNNPTNQMARLKNAGLNPNLIYGPGKATGNTSGQMPTYNAPRQEYNYKNPFQGNIVGTYQDINQKSAQIDNIKEQTDLLDQKSLTEAVVRAGKTLDNQKKSQNKAFWGRMWESQAQALEAKVKTENQRLGNLKAQRELTDKRATLTEAQTTLEQLKQMYLSKQIDWYVYKQLSGDVLRLLGIGVGLFGITRLKGKAPKGQGAIPPEIPTFKNPKLEITNPNSPYLRQ